MKHNDILDKPTVSPEEAVRLNGLRSIADIRVVEEIYDAYDAKNHKERYRNPTWYTFSLLATCWNAGRIEGVRMERRRRKKSSLRKESKLTSRYGISI